MLDNSSQEFALERQKRERKSVTRDVHSRDFPLSFRMTETNML